ncbi:LapA family protein [Salinarimonas rosea]|uniref:LapA family protein n=1 Tax=Salinarimonas rosea TaxID=552063 RepID=UPI0004217C14|nr:LapA family protein [Salinarimonas rosea]
MRRIVSLLILVPFALLVALLAMANRVPTRISLDPFTPESPVWSLTGPLWVVLFVTFTIGVVVGGCAAWLVQGKHRKAERTYKREATRLEREVERAKERAPQREAQTGLPALAGPRGR